MTLTTVRYGPLPGLWEAAHPPSGSEGASSSPRPETTASSVRDPAAAASVSELRLSFKLGIDGPFGARQKQQQQQQEKDGQQFDPQEGRTDNEILHQKQPHELDTATTTRRIDTYGSSSHMDPPPGHSRAPLWVQGGPGPTAKQMLHKLRYE